MNIDEHMVFILFNPVITNAPITLEMLDMTGSNGVARGSIRATGSRTCRGEIPVGAHSWVNFREYLGLFDV